MSVLEDTVANDKCFRTTLSWPITTSGWHLAAHKVWKPLLSQPGSRSVRHPVSCSQSLWPWENFLRFKTGRQRERVNLQSTHGIMWLKVNPSDDRTDVERHISALWCCMANTCLCCGPMGKSCGYCIVGRQRAHQMLVLHFRMKTATSRRVQTRRWWETTKTVRQMTENLVCGAAVGQSMGLGLGTGGMSCWFKTSLNCYMYGV